MPDAEGSVSDPEGGQQAAVREAAAAAETEDLVRGLHGCSATVIKDKRDPAGVAAVAHTISHYERGQGCR